MQLERGTRDKIGTGLHGHILLPHTCEWELYHNSFSVCSRKVRICLDELGLPYEGHHLHLIETGAYETVTPSFLAVNPKGTVPVLVHNGHPVYESHAQIEYLASHAGERGLRLQPDDPTHASLVHAWVDRASIVKPRDSSAEETRARAGVCVAVLTVPLFATMVRYIPYREIWKGLLTHPYKERPMMFLLFRSLGVRGLPLLFPAMAVIRRAHHDLEIHLDALSEQLRSHGAPWICGDNFTLADVSWAVLLDRLTEADWDTQFWGGDRRPSVAAYWERLRQRGSIQRQLEAMRCENTRLGMHDLKKAKRNHPRLRRALEGN